MRHTYLKKDFPAGNPIANILVVIAGALVIGVSLVLGFFAFVALRAVILVSAAFIGIRVWWLNRRRQAQAGPAVHKSGHAARGSTDVIEGEYHIIGDDRDET